MGILNECASEDVSALEGALCMAVLARLGGTDFKDLAGVGFHENIAVLAKGGGLGREGEGGFCVSSGLLIVVRTWFWDLTGENSLEEREQGRTSAAYFSSSEDIVSLF